MRTEPAARTFPRESARTRRFSLGAPRAFVLAPDGTRVAFLRSAHGTDPLQRLWVLELATGRQVCVADPAYLLGGGDEAVPPAERARRERAREQAGGIVAFATDRAVAQAVFPLGGRVFLADLGTASVRELDLPGPVSDPRLDPSGTRVAWVRAGTLSVTDLDTLDARTLAAGDGPDVTWGLAEFVAAEEMGRSRGFWWSPDGRRLAVTRVDVAPVERWHLADPVDPATPPATVRFPAAGTANAAVSLAVVEPGGQQVTVDWDAEALPYLARVRWQPGHPLTIAAQSRDQRRIEVRTVDEATGKTRLEARLEARPWLELVPGVPRWLGDGRLLTVIDDLAAGAHGTRRLAADGVPVTPEGLQIRQVAGADADGVLVLASHADPTEVGVWRVPLDGEPPQRLDAEGGVSSAVGAPGGYALTRAEMTSPGTVSTVQVRPGVRVAVDSCARRPSLEPRVQLLELGRRGLRGALVLPAHHTPGDGALPVLLDPYGGPHAQRVLRTRSAYLSAQWFAEEGFAVLVVDGRGSPGRGPVWEHAVAGDLAAAPLDDQVEALHAAARLHPALDLDRVAIRGWSFGGFLAALAVLRRPDVFHAAIAGAPVTDWRLYDTHYTERYLGDPHAAPEAYTASSLLGEPASPQRALLLIHGLADDNVVAAHTLRLSRALLEVGYPHRVLPLSGVTHMTPQEAVAENLLLLQLDFLRSSLGR